MLALRGGGGDMMAAAMAAMEASSTEFSDEFPDFSGGNLLDSIDFDDLFMGMQDDDVYCDDVLPDLEMDSDLLVGFELSGCEDEDVVSSGSDPANNISNNNTNTNSNNNNNNNNNKFELSGYDSVDKVEVKAEEKKAKRKKVAAAEVERGSSPESTTTTVNSSFKESDKGKNSSSHAKTGSITTGSNNNNNNQKRKAKVDWTPELHRRFVQAVEQLGVDKAVPSRILELMGIDCLTRHNIASHLQKYRSHRKHLLAREAEAASWTQKRQMYGVAVGGGGGGGVGGGKGGGGGGGGGGGANISPTPWHQPPTMGFPPPMTPIHHHHPHSFRPLHVWGHPSMDLQSRMPMWPKQVVASPSPPPPPSAWTPPPPPIWHSSSHNRRFTTPPVPGIPPHAMYRPAHSGGGAPPQPGLDALPTKESIDSALGDVLAKPWLPLPIGLKPPSVDSVLVELQRQGVPKIPPSSSSSS